MGRRLLLIGGGGHCHSVIDSVISLNTFEEIGIIDNMSTPCLEINVVGTDGDLPRLIFEGWLEAFITVGSVGNTMARRRLYEMVKGLGFVIPTIIDPSVIIAKGCEISEGTFIGKRAVVNSGSSLGICTIINTGAIVEHDCSIGDFSHISPGAVLCGQVKVGSDSHIGAGSVVRQHIVIGNHALIGLGSVVIKDLPDDVKAYGNPCKVVE